MGAEIRDGEVVAGKGGAAPHPEVELQHMMAGGAERRRDAAGGLQFAAVALTVVEAQGNALEPFALWPRPGQVAESSPPESRMTAFFISNCTPGSYRQHLPAKPRTPVSAANAASHARNSARSLASACFAFAQLHPFRGQRQLEREFVQTFSRHNFTLRGLRRPQIIL